MKFKYFFKKTLFEEENEDIKNYTADDYDKYINLFNQSKTNVIKNIQNKAVGKHNDAKMFEVITNILNTLQKEYNTKEMAHQNTFSIKAKRNELIKAMQEYNKALNDYKETVVPNALTFGDYFRSIGKQTSKSSIKTER